MAKVVIIGNGISGITAARFTRKLSNDQISVISSESDYFFSRTALMYVYMGHMRWKDIEPYEPEFWKKNRIELINGRVDQIDFDNKRLYLSDGSTKDFDKLILATGSKLNRINLPGEQLNGVSGLYSKQDLQYIESYGAKIKHAVIVGGGLIGIELAEMFHSRNIPVTFLVRESEYHRSILPQEEAEMISNHIRAHQIDLKLHTQLKEIIDDGNGNAAAIITNHGEKIPCDFVGLTIGVLPNVDFLRSGPLDIEKGILVNDYLETNIPDVYAIGDCAQIRIPQPGRRNIEAVWYTGRIMGETVAHTICNQKTAYNPGIWFNSAKFFDIEYQVYGNVPARIYEPLTSFYWESGNGNKSIRIVFDSHTLQVKGFNLMGIRFRHEVCEKWIQMNTNLDDVVANIRLAFFDPEFFVDVAPFFLKKYNSEFNKSITLKSSNSLNAVLQFFKNKSSS
jgi:NADPH-dependent 2,4-dienoyl-CoA reductase/sulfur reductase-like enzyme